jgi:hypothetical protein
VGPVGPRRPVGPRAPVGPFVFQEIFVSFDLQTVLALTILI